MRPFFQFKSLRSRLVFWFLVVALIPLLVVSALLSTQRIAAIKQREADKLTAIRDLKVRQVEQWLTERIGDVQTISEDLEIRDLERILTGGLSKADQAGILNNSRLLLARYLDNYTAYRELLIVDPQSGRVLISTDPQSEGRDLSEAQYFQEPLQTKALFIQDILYSKRLNKPTMALALPIFCRTHEQHIVGILVTWVDLEQSLYALLLERAGMGQTGETLIVNAQGLALSELRWHAQAPLRLKIEAKPAVFAAQGQTGIIETEDYRDVEVLAIYTNIPLTGWGFVAKQDIREIFAPIQTMLRQIALLVLLAGILVVVLALSLAKTIARPVKELARVAKKLGSGVLSARNEIQSQDELGTLGQSFNNMAESLASQLTIHEQSVALGQTVIAAKDLAQFQEDILHTLMDMTNSQIGIIYHFNVKRQHFEPVASLGARAERLVPFEAVSLEGQLGPVLKDKVMVHLDMLSEETVFTFKTFAGDVLPREMISLPLLEKDRVEAIVCLASLQSFSRASLTWLRDIGTVLNLGLSNHLSAAETRQLAETLQIRNEELQAQSEELQTQSEELQQQSAELQAQNRELESQRQRVEAADRMKSEFLSNMSHELRTPLNSIMALSKVLRMQTGERLTSEETGYLDIIQRNGRNLLALINDILDLSRIESGRMEVHCQCFDPAATLGDIIERLEPLALEKGVELHWTILGEVQNIKSDETRIHHILQNLIGNAVKFTEQGQVRVSLYQEGQELKVVVQDTGIGIAEEHLSLIFEEFQQVDGSISRKYDGTGLGLAIASKTAHILGGTLSVDSSPGQGSVFTLSLPLTLQAEAQPVEAEEQSSVPERPGSKKLLVVDDNPAARIQICHILEQDGLFVLTAQNGQEALDLVRRQQPDGILHDLMMPAMDGFSVLQAIRGHQASIRIPVLVLTAKDLSKEELGKLEANNIQQLIQKGDVNKAELIRAVERMLGWA